MQALILKVSFAALIGTTMLGTLYSQVVRPRLARLSQQQIEPPKHEFQWNWLPDAQSNPLLVPPVAGLAAGSRDERGNGERNWVAVQGEAVEAVGVGGGFQLPAEFSREAVPAEAAEQDAAPEEAKVSQLLAPEGSVETLASPGPGTEEVFQSALLGVGAAVEAAAATNSPEEPAAAKESSAPAGPESRELTTGGAEAPPDVVAVSVTVVPEPLPAILLASGLVALSITGLIQQRRRG